MKTILPILKINSAIGLTTNSSSENFAVLGLVDDKEYLKSLYKSYLANNNEPYSYRTEILEKLSNFLDQDFYLIGFRELVSKLFDYNLYTYTYYVEDYSAILKELNPELHSICNLVLKSRSKNIKKEDFFDLKKVREIIEKNKNNTYLFAEFRESYSSYVFPSGFEQVLEDGLFIIPEYTDNGS